MKIQLLLLKKAGSPTKVVIGDISVRDGLQHEEKFIPTRAKLWLAEQLILAGFKRIEVTNFGNPNYLYIEEILN